MVVFAAAGADAAAEGDAMTTDVSRVTEGWRRCGVALAGLLLFVLVGAGWVAAGSRGGDRTAGVSPAASVQAPDIAASGTDPACPSGAAESFTPTTPEQAGVFLFFSDVHLSPFADPSLVKALVAAPVGQWSAILAGGKPGYAAYGQDSNDALLQSTLDDMARRTPKPDFILFGGDLLCHKFWTLYPALSGDASPAGLTAFIAKTVEYFLTETTRRFPGVPLYVALGNNDSVEGDYSIAPNSPYLAATAEVTARLALKTDAARTAFLATYPQYGGYAVTLPEAGGLRLIVIDDIFWSKKYPHPGLGGPVAAFLERELAAARQAGQPVWFMTHIPPGDNALASARKYLKTGKAEYASELLDAPNDTLARLLTEYAPTIKASFAGHVHRDYMRLFYGDAGGRAVPVGMMRVAPSISPVTGNNPGYQVYAYDRRSAAILDETTYFLDLGATRPAWAVEYVYSQTYGRGLRAADDWQAMFTGLPGCPARRQAFGDFYDVKGPHDAVTDRTFPIFWRGVEGVSRATFDAPPVPPASGTQ
ncbi:MAG: metallophosphoesterase [Solidesulfovibrio sp.]